MSLRRSVVVLLLIAAVTALALSVGVGAPAPGDAQAPSTDGGAAIGRERGPGLDAALVRVRLDERSVADGQRSSKTGLALLAVLAVLALVPSLVPRRAATGSSMPVRKVWRSPIRGRAPPHFQLAVI